MKTLATVSLCAFLMLLALLTEPVLSKAAWFVCGAAYGDGVANSSWFSSGLTAFVLVITATGMCAWL